MEYFASFKWSCKTTERFSEIVVTRFKHNQEELEKGVYDFVIKFLNEYSHGQDFSRPITASLFEAQPIAQNTLKFIELADKEHYDELKKLCTTSLHEI